MIFEGYAICVSRVLLLPSPLPALLALKKEGYCSAPKPQGLNHKSLKSKKAKQKGGSVEICVAMHIYSLSIVVDSDC